MTAAQAHDIRDTRMADAMVICSINEHLKRDVVLNLLRSKLGCDRQTADEFFHVCELSL